MITCQHQSDANQVHCYSSSQKQPRESWQYLSWVHRLALIASIVSRTKSKRHASANSATATSHIQSMLSHKSLLRTQMASNINLHMMFYSMYTYNILGAITNFPWHPCSIIPNATTTIPNRLALAVITFFIVAYFLSATAILQNEDSYWPLGDKSCDGDSFDIDCNDDIPI